MSDLNTINQKAHYSLGDILHRVALPFFLFAFVLMSLLFLSWALLLPKFTHVDIGGSVRSLNEMRVLRADLLSQIEGMEEDRAAFLSPVTDATYLSLMEEKEGSPGLLILFRDIERLAQSAVPEVDNAVVIQHFAYSANDDSLVLSGRVQNVGPRSMTVLAQFVEEAGKLPGVASVNAPRFERKEDEMIGFYSPFAITIILK